MHTYRNTGTKGISRPANTCLSTANFSYYVIKQNLVFEELCFPLVADCWSVGCITQTKDLLFYIKYILLHKWQISYSADILFITRYRYLLRYRSPIPLAHSQLSPLLSEEVPLQPQLYWSSSVEVRMSVTRPVPMVLFPSLKVNRWPFSRTIGWRSVSVKVVSSPGITIS